MSVFTLFCLTLSTRIGWIPNVKLFYDKRFLNFSSLSIWFTETILGIFVLYVNVFLVAIRNSGINLNYFDIFWNILWIFAIVCIHMSCGKRSYDCSIFEVGVFYRVICVKIRNKIYCQNTVWIEKFDFPFGNFFFMNWQKDRGSNIICCCRISGNIWLVLVLQDAVHLI